MGTESAEILYESRYWYNYDFPENVRAWGKYKGQSQKWFLMRFLGNDKEININEQDNPEFINWFWSDLELLPTKVVDFKRDVYFALVEEFVPIINGYK